MGNEPSKPPPKKEQKKKKKSKKPKKENKRKENDPVKTYPYPDPEETSVFPKLNEDYHSFKVCAAIFSFLNNFSLFHLNKYPQTAVSLNCQSQSMQQW